MSCTVTTATVLWAGQSVQQLYCGLDSQYSDCIVGWTVSTATVLWAGQSVQWLSFELDARALVVWFLALARILVFSTHPYWLGDPLSLRFIWFCGPHEWSQWGVHLTTFLCLMPAVLPLRLYAFIVPLLWCFKDAFFPVPAEFRFCHYEPVIFVYLRMYRLKNHLCYS
jgi:hypothetical protein